MTNRHTYPSSSFGYLLGIALTRQTSVSIGLPNESDPTVQFPIAPVEFANKFRSTVAELDLASKPVRPRDRSLSSVLSISEADSGDSINLYLPDRRKQTTSTTWPDNSSLEIRRVGVPDDSTFPRFILFDDLVCYRTIEMRESPQYKIERNQYDSQEKYLQENFDTLPISL